ncbi:acyl-CoA dehydrogenase [Xinfangfangia sp. D13-10-4-6]|uniref:acyl-CoA dehydrogenase family protein n=1 Tax=Pseudogemmobacter hezensis TaxID=2737662 RepID=UPI001557E8B9|nr:acyl-CoA dehydrogenase family protein [Pseudogemmobacter hezensis]NPD15427.1 acyl-CoA dehydrogenase [Pseudogemmobacter hezensis]
MSHARTLAKDQRFILDHLVDFDAVTHSGRFAGADAALVDAILEGAARLCDEVVAPVNRAGDLTPARLEGGRVRASPGYAAAYREIAAGGWVGLAAPQAYGGMGLPFTLATCVNEMLAGACVSLQLKPLLSQGQIEALDHHASDALKTLYLPKLISGEWSGTMNLTEPQAGSDVGALQCRAVPDGKGEQDGQGGWLVSGQKIFITWGDSDLVSNVCHLVLARLPDAVPGVKGISLFLVPKFLPDAAGNPGAANSLHVVSLEHKLGLHGSPTCVMQFDAAKGWLVGAAGQGMAAMFTMMNNARLGIGMQGVGLGEAALQKATRFAQDRVQGRTPDGSAGIIGHADVRRMLAEARAGLFAARAIGLRCAAAIDMAAATKDPAWAARAALLTPIAKAFGTDTGISVADICLQVHGGMGYIEETGAAQYLRDARITAIYEGTNGIQAMDLVGRKLADNGEAALALITEIGHRAAVAMADQPELAAALTGAALALEDATKRLLLMPLNARFAGAVSYLRAFALVLGGDAHLRAGQADPARLPLARVMINRLLSAHQGLLAAALAGAEGLYEVSADMLG